MNTRSSTAARDLLQRLTPLISGEIASIGALDTATQHEDNPGYVVLYRIAKTEKQANVQQMVSLLRMLGESPPRSGGIAEPFLKLQTLLLQKVDTTLSLRAMRRAEAALVEGYRLQGEERGGVAVRALAKPLRRALKRWHVPTAHIARRDDRGEEAGELPYPLDRYFATDRTRVCMRCLLDRSGPLPALERREPHPYTYICAACHAEVLDDLPADLREQADRWPTELRGDRIMERALGHPQRLKASEQALAVLSGLDPEIHLPAAERAWKEPTERQEPQVAENPPPVLVTASDEATPTERSYSERLFDFRSVREHW